MIGRLVKIYIGAVVVLIVASSMWDILPLEAVLPAAIPLAIIAYIVIAVLKKMGILPDSTSSTGYTPRKATYGDGSSSTPKTRKATKAKAEKPKKLGKPKCKNAILMNAHGNTYCCCKSKGARTRSRYAHISGRNGEVVTGSSSKPLEDGNDWTLCFGGRCKNSGITPSKCRYYVTPR